MPVEVRDGWEQTERLIDQLVSLNRQIKHVSDRLHGVPVRAENAFEFALDDDIPSSCKFSSSVGVVGPPGAMEGEARKGFASGGPAGAAPLELQVEELLSEMVAKWTSGRSIDSEIVRLRALNDQMHAMKQRETECCSGVSDK